MRSRWIFLAGGLAYLAVALDTLAADRQARPQARFKDLIGTVVSRDGRPIAGATVSVVSVGPRAGKSTISPWCHPDCGKHTVSGADGRFVINDVDPAWLFTLAAEAKDCLPRELLVDPRSAMATKVRLISQQDRITAGLVLMPDGAPAANAEVSVLNYRIEAAGPHGRPVVGGMKVVTDDAGKFRIESEALLKSLEVSVEVRDVCQKVFELKPGAKEQTLQLTAGATVTGRVLRNARPAVGVAVGLVAADPNLSQMRHNLDTVTDAKGNFTIKHVYPHHLYRVFTKGARIEGEPLSAIIRDFVTPDDGKTILIGELNLHPTHRVRGRLLLLDSKALIPPETFAVLERMRAVDRQEAPVSVDGTFAFDGVPAETVVLSFHTQKRASVNGFRLSGRNLSLDDVHQATLIGRVDDDLELIVLAQKGNGSDYQPGNPTQLLASPSNSRSVIRRRLETETLMGVTPELQSPLVERAKRDKQAHNFRYFTPDQR